MSLTPTVDARWSSNCFPFRLSLWRDRGTIQAGGADARSAARDHQGDVATALAADLSSKLALVVLDTAVIHQSS